MADEQVLTDAWRVLKGERKCPMCDGTGVGDYLTWKATSATSETTPILPPVWEVEKRKCEPCDGTGWTTLARFRKPYWERTYQLGAYMSIIDEEGIQAISEEAFRWQRAIRELSHEDY